MKFSAFELSITLCTTGLQQNVCCMLLLPLIAFNNLTQLIIHPSYDRIVSMLTNTHHTLLHSVRVYAHLAEIYCSVLLYLQHILPFCHHNTISANCIAFFILKCQIVYESSLRLHRIIKREKMGNVYDTGSNKQFPKY